MGPWRDPGASFSPRVPQNSQGPFGCPGRFRTKNRNDQKLFPNVKVKIARENLQNNKVLMMDPVGSKKGPWLARETMGLSSKVPRIP